MSSCFDDVGEDMDRFKAVLKLLKNPQNIWMDSDGDTARVLQLL